MREVKSIPLYVSTPYRKALVKCPFQLYTQAFTRERSTMVHRPGRYDEICSHPFRCFAFKSSILNLKILLQFDSFLTD